MPCTYCPPAPLCSTSGGLRCADRRSTPGPCSSPSAARTQHRAPASQGTGELRSRLRSVSSVCEIIDKKPHCAAS
eukprot:2823419-Rhodomonas_salina.1